MVVGADRTSMRYRACRTVVDTSISGRRVVRELTDLIAERGRPKMIVSDNGTELTSNAVRAKSGDVGSQTVDLDFYLEQRSKYACLKFGDRSGDSRHRNRRPVSTVSNRECESRGNEHRRSRPAAMTGASD